MPTYRVNTPGPSYTVTAANINSAAKKAKESLAKVLRKGHTQEIVKKGGKVYVRNLNSNGKLVTGCVVYRTF